MNYSDMIGGTWYTKGGMVSVVNGMHQLALELGVKFVLNADVSKIKVNNNKADEIIYADAHKGFDALVSSADYNFTEQKLLDEPYRNY